MRAAVVVALLGLAAVARADDLEDAKIHYMAGAAYYKSGEWAAAKREFEEAFRLSKRGPLLFNIALCEEKLGEYDRAVESLRAYLETAEGAKERATVEGKLREDEERAARREPAPPPAAPTTEALTVQQLERAVPPSPPRSPATRRAGFGLLAAGGILLATSLALGLTAHARYTDLEGRCGDGGKMCPPDFSSDRDLGRGLAIGADALLGVGVAAAAVSVVLILWRPRAQRTGLAPSGTGFAVSF